uniref:Ig-like domain-containing protein n=1 Tax=Strigamia maritima TaxID=126957 RepID=T1JAQ0_STRMM
MRRRQLGRVTVIAVHENPKGHIAKDGANEMQGVQTLEIKHFIVPTVVQSGTPGPLILDCNYEYLEKEKNSIVVKWYHETGPIDNKTSQQVYQWITTLKPQALGALKGRLDIQYEASTDPHTKHRALSILHPTVDLTGDYKCHISSNFNDDDRSQKMVVYSPAKAKNLKVAEPISNQVNVTCLGYGLYPEPNIEITIKKDDSAEVADTTPKVIDSNMRVIPRQEGLYDIEGYKLFDFNSLSKDTIFVCKLSVPETTYAILIESVFAPRTPDTDPRPEPNSAKSKLDKNKESSLTGSTKAPDVVNGIWQLHQQERTLLSVSTVLLICLWTLVV